MYFYFYRKKVGLLAFVMCTTCSPAFSPRHSMLSARNRKPRSSRISMEYYVTKPVENDYYHTLFVKRYFSGLVPLIFVNIYFDGYHTFLI